MRFRPCIDLHQGTVKQIVGGTLRDGAGPVTNFVATQPPRHFAERYRQDGLVGGHVIMLGSGNEAAAREALAAYPGGLQIGGGVTAANADEWLDAGAAKVIVTSYVFRGGRVCWDHLAALEKAVGADRLVLDLSCRERDGAYLIVTDRWQVYTQVAVGPNLWANWLRTALNSWCTRWMSKASRPASMQRSCGYSQKSASPPLPMRAASSLSRISTPSRSSPAAASMPRPAAHLIFSAAKDYPTARPWRSTAPAAAARPPH